jgi:hypothetical protein
MKTRLARGAVVLFLIVLAVFAAVSRAVSNRDPLAAEIERWTAAVRDTSIHDELWKQSAPAAAPVLDAAADALRHDRRLLALHRLSRARTPLAAALYAREHPDAGTGIPALEAEWTKVGATLGRDSVAAAAAIARIEPALVRALAEASSYQSRIHHGASLDYGKNTEPVYGLYYLGVADAQRGFVAFCRRLPVVKEGRRPPVRSIAGEIDSLESELLAAYRPPASIDRHPEFIRVSADLKEARELDAQRLRHAALLRYCEAVQRVGLLVEPPSAGPADTNALRSKLDRAEAMLAGERVDHSIARLFVETARSDLSAPAARVIVTRVLPRYRAALAPVPPPTARPAPALAVTLVRWPFT